MLINPQNLALLSQPLDWHWMARQEMDRRAAEFIQLLPIEMLRSIVASELVIPDLAQDL